ncbi:MAG TPA: serine hydrolase, partial [Thermoanaerobaculaceae bacterium]|nr:serine hydrolase [Thermoanaerobaculaceae bacterium]
AGLRSAGESTEISPIAALGLAMASEAQSDLALVGLDHDVDVALATLGVPGLAIAVVSPSRVIMARGFGWRDVEERLPVTPDTVFPIGSATKSFTSFVLATLADEHKVDFFAPVRDVLPDFRLLDPLATERATVADLLTHRTGVPRHDAVWFGHVTPTRSELVARLQYLQPSARFRGKFQYSNLMYVAAGRLAEVATGRSWEDLVGSRILSPLGMSRTFFSLEATRQAGDYATPNRASGDEVRPVGFRDASAVAPAGGLWSSANDLARWVRMLLMRGEWEGRRLVDPGTLTELFRPITPTRMTVSGKELTQPYYGLGWFVDTYRGRLRVYHGGNLDGFTSLVTLFPNESYGVVILANIGASNLPEALVRSIADRLFKLSRQDWLGRASRAREGARGARERVRAVVAMRRITGSAPELPLGAYVGRYENPGYGELAIELGDRGLDMVFNGIRSPLEHWHFETFNTGTSEDPSFEDLKVTFVTSGAALPLAVLVPFEPAVPAIEFKRVEPRKLDVGWLTAAVGEYLDGQSEVTVEKRDGRPYLRWPGVAEGELVARTWGEARLDAAVSVTVRYVPATSSDPPRLLLYTPDSVRMAIRTER